MKHIYYFIGLCFIIYELSWLINPVKKAKESRHFNKLIKGDYKTLGFKSLSKEDQNLIVNKAFTSILYLFWFLIGLLTFNWVAFLIFIIFNFAIVVPLQKLLMDKWIYAVLLWVNSLIGLAFGLFVIINSYHLKINLFEYFSNLW